VLENGCFRDVQITIPGFAVLCAVSRLPSGATLRRWILRMDYVKTLYHSPESLQAPNWTPDGKALIYNSKRSPLSFGFGKEYSGTYQFRSRDKQQQRPRAVRLTAKCLASATMLKEDGNSSIVFVLPTQGGAPTRITKTGPSYLHGWSPDRKFLISRTNT